MGPSTVLVASLVELSLELFAKIEPKSPTTKISPATQRTVNCFFFGAVVRL